MLCGRLFVAARQRSFDAERISERMLHSSQRKEGDHVTRCCRSRTAATGQNSSTSNACRYNDIVAP
jgi:hypothetical protein